MCLQERNKPIQPPAKPKAAPFFLPTVPGFSGRPEFASDDSASAAAAQGSRVGKLAGSLTSGSPLLLALRKGSEGCATALELLRGMAPVAIDREFRALQVSPLRQHGACMCACGVRLAYSGCIIWQGRAGVSRGVGHDAGRPAAGYCPIGESIHHGAMCVCCMSFQLSMDPWIHLTCIALAQALWHYHINKRRLASGSIRPQHRRSSLQVLGHAQSMTVTVAFSAV